MARAEAVMTRYLLMLFALGVGSLLPALPSPAQDDTLTLETPGERILGYRSEITVARDGSMEVRETIRVQAAQQQIRHGIYRDFPTRYRDRLGNFYTVGFEVLETRRDGHPEPYDIDELEDGKRVRIGDEDRELTPGVYTYSLAYRTTRQIGFFVDHDELYWNVTGNGWVFPIDKVTATVVLPAGVQPQAILLDGYTGVKGSLGKDFESSVETEVRPTYVTTRPLDSYEGLTIVVSWPKGFIAAPTREMKWRWFFEDNLSTLLGLAGLVILLLYYAAVWVLVGRDPAGESIGPLYDPPPGISPAAMRYLSEMGFDHRTCAAAILSLAVNRCLTIEEKEGTYTLVRGQGDLSKVAPEERAVAEKLFASGISLQLVNTNHARINLAIEALKTWLRLNLEKIYFFTNRKYLIPGLVWSVVVLIAVAAAAPGPMKFVAAFLTVWLSFWSIGVYFLLGQVFQSWRDVFRKQGGAKAAAAGGAIFITLFSLPFLVGEVVAIYLLGNTAIVILLLVAGVNFLFHYLLKAPTRAGRDLMDKIDGFKMFLRSTLEDRMKMMYSPMLTPDLYEKYLPYAMALGVEEPWSEQFASIMEVAAQHGTEHRHPWYSGPTWRTIGAAAFATSLGGAFSSAIASSSTPPSSRSGSRSSGGSSGGGGGGGGGGGW